MTSFESEVFQTALTMKEAFLSSQLLLAKDMNLSYTFDRKLYAPLNQCYASNIGIVYMT